MTRNREDHLSGAAFQLLVAAMIVGASFEWNLGPFVCVLAWFPLRWACVRIVRAVEAGPPTIDRCEASGCVRPPGHNLPHRGVTGREEFGQSDA